MDNKKAQSKPVIQLKEVVMLAAILIVGILTVSMVSAGPKAKPECNDGRDNDGDGRIDLQDAGCSSRTDNDETNCGDSVCEGGETATGCPADCGPADSCSDTDFGSIITVYGTTSGFLNGNPYSNSDYCFDSGNVVENYCSGTHSASQQQSCGSDSFGNFYCLNNSVYRDFVDYYCGSPGACGSNVNPIYQYSCGAGGNTTVCVNGACV